MNARTGQSWPEEHIITDDIKVVPQLVLIDEETGECVRQAGISCWLGMRAGAKYRCETEWLLMAGWYATLATFKSQGRALEALETLVREIAERKALIYISNEEA